MADDHVHDQAVAPEPLPKPTVPEPDEPVTTDQAERASVTPRDIIDHRTGDSQPGAVTEREIDPIAALDEAKEREASRSEQRQTGEEAAVKDVVDILVPKSAPKQWVIGPPDSDGLKFMQKRLSFIGKMQWFALVGGVLDKALAPGGLSINELLATPGQRGQSLSADDLRDADTFVRAVGKVLVYAPEFLLDSYCIWLAVPELQKGLVKEIMSAPEEEGGLTDEQGLEIIEVFIDQNFDALADFFGEKIGALRKRVEARLEARNKNRVA